MLKHTVRVGRVVIGAILLVLGAILSLPLVPGPGVLLGRGRARLSRVTSSSGRAACVTGAISNSNATRGDGMSNDKDHLAEQLKDRERAEEERFFAEHSKKQIEKLRAMHQQTAATATCPRCGAALEVLTRNGIAADACPKDHGIWLDWGELEQITKREGDGWLARLILGKKG
jgi:hypothetical protein